MPRTWGGIQHRLIATTHVSSSWVRAVHLVQVDQTARAATAARRAGNGDTPVQVFDPLFALQLLKSLAFMRGKKALPMALGLLRGLSAATSTGTATRMQARAAGAGTHCAVSFIGGPTCMYPFMDEHDYDVLRSAASVGKAFHAHYYRKGRGLAYYQISAEAARSRIF